MVIAGNVGQNISKEQVRRRATTSQTAKSKMWLWEKKIAKHAEDCRLLEVTVNERKTDQSSRGDPVHS